MVGNQQSSPSASTESSAVSSSGNVNNSNNYSSGDPTSPDYVRRNVIPGGLGNQQFKIWQYCTYKRQTSLIHFNQIVAYVT